MNLPLSQRAICTGRRQKSGHNGLWSNCSCCVCTASVWSSPCDTGYVLMLHIHGLKSSIDINKELTVSLKYGLLYIYLNRCHWVQADYLPHGPEWCLIGLHVGYWRMLWRLTGKIWSYGAHPPETFTNWCPWPQYHSCCQRCPSDGQSSFVDRYWGSSNCFAIDLQSQLITDPW